MPNGTIQDSRMPTSPQWGYLKVKDPNTIPIRKRERRCSNDDWNEYLLFFNDLDIKKNNLKNGNPDPAKFYKKYVTFKLEKAEVKIKGHKKPIKITVARVTGLRRQNKNSSCNC